MRRMLLGLVAGALVCACLWVASPASALSCEGPAEGDVVFVGTVVSVANRFDAMPDDEGTWARFAVEEVWRNWPPDELGSRVEVRSGPKLKNGSFASPYSYHRFQLGQRYLVNAHHPSDPNRNAPADQYWGAPPDGLAVRPCVATPQVFTDELASERPADAVIVPQSMPIASEPWPGSDSSPPYVTIALTTVLVAGCCLYLLFRRGSIAQRARQDEGASSPS